MIKMHDTLRYSRFQYTISMHMIVDYNYTSDEKLLICANVSALRTKAVDHINCLDLQNIQ